MELITHSVEETQKFAYDFAKNINAPFCISLSGEMGAGKTAFSQGFARGLGIDEPITSPTFAIMNVYEFNDNNFFKHLDLYRIEDEEELNVMGMYDEVYNLNTIALIEWASNAPNFCKQIDLVIRIEKVDENTRKIIVGENNENIRN